jgi:formamidopyrimidine-DNA glycosylase
MPEICEVLLTTQYLSKIIGKYITNIKILGGRYLKKNISGMDKLSFPLKIINIQSHGKFLWMTLKDDNNMTLYMMNTFGLTGKWSYEKIEHSNVKFVVKKSKSSDKKISVYFCDMRNFGTVSFTNSETILHNKLDKLAVDMLQNDISKKDFSKLIENYKNRKKKIIVVLMNQNKKDGIVSGLGNYLVPEILYRSKISPHRTLNELSEKEIGVLYKTIKYVLKLCYMTNETEYISHMKKFLDSHTEKVKSGKYPNYLPDVKIGNDKFQFMVYRKKLDPHGNKVIGEKIITGRTAYWCPYIQS